MHQDLIGYLQAYKECFEDSSDLIDELVEMVKQRLYTWQQWAEMGERHKAIRTCYDGGFGQKRLITALHIVDNYMAKLQQVEVNCNE